MNKKFLFKIKVIAFAFLLVTMMVETSKAQCTILNQTPTVNPATLCGAGTVTVSIPSSEVGVTYAVASGTTIVSGPTAGTGQPMTFTVGPLSTTTTLLVGATNGSCTVAMTPAVTVTVNPLPTVIITPSHTAICKGSS